MLDCIARNSFGNPEDYCFRCDDDNLAKCIAQNGPTMAFSCGTCGATNSTNVPQCMLCIGDGLNTGGCYYSNCGLTKDCNTKSCDK